MTVRALEGDELAAARAPAEAVATGGFFMPPEIRTRRLTLTPFALHQLDAFARLFGDAQTQRYVGGIGGAVGRTLAYQRMAVFSGQWRLYGFGTYALSDEEGHFLGYAGLWFPHDRPDIEIAYGLLPGARGKGYAAEAVRAIRQTAEACGCPALVSYIARDNEGSRRVAASAGATIDGALRMGDTVADIWRYPMDPQPIEASGDELMVDASVMPLTIATRRLLLCQWRPDHFARFAAHLADAETARFIGGQRSFYEAARLFSAAAGDWHLRGYGEYAVEFEDRLVGIVGLFHPENWPERELAYSITTDARRQGFAAEAVRAVRDVAAAQGLRRLVSYIDPDNAASLAVARRVGAEPIGETTFNGSPDLIFRHAIAERDPGSRSGVLELEPAQ